MITPVMSFRSIPASANRLRVSTPYSSTVCSRAVVNRQLAISSSPRNTPSTVFVFPTSIVSSISSPWHRLLACTTDYQLPTPDFQLLHLTHIPCNHRHTRPTILLHNQ